jgi:hypothetical protein
MARSHAYVIHSRSRTKAPVVERRAAPAKPAGPVPAPRPSDRRVQPLTYAGALSGSKTELLRLAVRRSRLALACPCGGRALRVKCTTAERSRFGGESFARAFVCAACRTRYVGRAKPLHDWGA